MACLGMALENVYAGYNGFMCCLNAFTSFLLIVIAQNGSEFSNYYYITCFVFNSVHFFYINSDALSTDV